MKVHNLTVTGSLTSGGEVITSISSSTVTKLGSLSSSLSTSIGSLSSSMASSMTSLSSSLTSSMGSLSSSMASSMTSLSSSLTGSMGSLSSSMVTSMNSLSSSMGSIMATTGSNLFKGDQTISGSIIPAVNSSYDLGSPTNEFRHLYLSSASLYIDGTKVLGSTTQELQITTDTGQSFKILEAGSDTITLQAADGNITLATSGGGDVILDPTSGVIALKGTTTLYAGNKILSSDGNAIQIGNSVTMTGSLIVTGFIETQELRTTYISSSILYRSGSTKFGDELTDTHSFTGSLSVSGSISIPESGLVSGSSQITYSGLSGVPSGIISGSAQLPSGLVSGSSQILNGSGIWSGSAQLPSGIVSSSAQTIANLPSGTVSGSVQVDVMSTTNIARLATTGSNVFTGALTGTTATFSGNMAIKTSIGSYGLEVNDDSGVKITTSGDARLLLNSSAASGLNWSLLSYTTGNFVIGRTGVSDLFTFTAAGSITLGPTVGTGVGALYAGAATFSSGVEAASFYTNDTRYIANQIQSGYNANSEDSDIWINYTGYQGGTTRFRDFRVGNGKQGQIALFDGSTGGVTFSNSLTVATTGTFGFQDYRTQDTQKVLVLNAEGVSGQYAPSLFNIYTKPGTTSNGVASIIIKSKYSTDTESSNLFEFKGDGSATFSSSVRAASLSMNVGSSADRILYISANLPTTGASQFQSVMNGTFINAATTLYGMYVGNNSNVNVTNSYALFLESTGGSGTITNKYGVYQSGGSDKNYFAGNVGINTTSFGYVNTKLQVNGTSTTDENAGTVFIQHSFSGTNGFGLAISRNSSSAAALSLGADSSNNAIISANNTNLRLGKNTSGTFYEYLNINTSGLATFSNNIRMGTFPNSTSNSGEAWIGRASDRNAGTMTVQLGGGSASNRSFEVVDYSWTTVLFNVSSAGVGAFSSHLSAAGNITASGNIINQGAIFTQAGVTRHCFSGNVAGNASITFTINCQTQSVFRITCMMNHYGYVTSYGCANIAFIGMGPVITVNNVSDIQTGNGGSWTYARISDTQFTVTKNAGTYGGGGNYFVEIVGNNSY